MNNSSRLSLMQLARAIKNALQSVLSAMVGWKLRLLGVRLGRQIFFNGAPIVSGAGFGRICIGDGVVLISRSVGTWLGVRSRVVLRLLAQGAELSIGEDCALSGTVICSAVSVRIGKRCLVGADVMIFDTDFHNRQPEGRRFAVSDWPNISKPVVIGDDIFIGTRAIVMKGVTIGDGSIVGAGSVVTSDIPPRSIAAGVPARVVAIID
jgi:acetyltransferase-like isoleucine patch superfamily enzyme